MDEIDDIITCPITMVVMREPVVADDGHTYERRAITEWVKRKGTSPLTRERMSSHFVPNMAIRKMIERLKSSVDTWLGSCRDNIAQKFKDAAEMAKGSMFTAYLFVIAQIVLSIVTMVNRMHMYRLGLLQIIVGGWQQEINVRTKRANRENDVFLFQSRKT